MVREEYTRNPATVLLLPEKPSDRRRELALRRDAEAETDRTQRLEELKQKDPRAHADVVGRLERADTSPRKKYAFPLTTSQEIGWSAGADTRNSGREMQRSCDKHARAHVCPLCLSSSSLLLSPRLSHRDLEFARRHAAESRDYVSPHTNSDVAAFADKYVANHGYNPFSTKQFKYLARK